MTPEERARLLRKASRLLHKGMPAGGRHGTRKGKAGYTRKAKHKGGQHGRDK